MIVREIKEVDMSIGSTAKREVAKMKKKAYSELYVRIEGRTCTDWLDGD